MYKLNNIALETYGISPIKLAGEDLAVKGIFDLPERIGDTHNNWDDSDSVEPFVDFYDINLAGRTLYFAGLLVGTKVATENKLTAFRTAIAAFNNVARFETPYGTACVYIKKITPKFYNEGATIIIEMREPIVGAVCNLIGVLTTYYSIEYSESAAKNDCAAGYYGSSVQLTSIAGKFTSTYSQTAANQLAIDWVKSTKQLYANEQGTCILNPTVYYNAAVTGELQKNDCSAFYIGTIVTYSVPSFKYSSLLSQLDADNKAQAEIDSVLTQTYANANGTCVILPSITLIDNLDYFSNINWNEKTFEVGQYILVGTLYSVQIYGVKKSYSSIGTDTPADIMNALATLINNTTLAQWQAANQYPLDLNASNKPFVTIVTNHTFKIKTVAPSGVIAFIE